MSAFLLLVYIDCFNGRKKGLEIEAGYERWQKMHYVITISIQTSLEISDPKSKPIRGVHRVGYKRSTRPDKIFNKPEHDPIPERRKPDDPNPTRPEVSN